MCSILTFLIYLHFSSLCLSAPALFDNSDESAWDMFSQPDADADVGGLQSYSALDETSDINPQFFDGLNLGGADSDSHSDSDSSMFQPFDESSQDHQAIDSYQEIFAGKGNECSFNDLLPASRLRPRADWCEQKPDPAILNLKIPTLDNLPGRKLPSPGPLNSPSWQPLNGILFNRPEVENPQVCPMSFRNWYYIPVCGIRLGDQGKYSPTELNSLRGWTVTDASICESASVNSISYITGRKRQKLTPKRRENRV